MGLGNDMNIDGLTRDPNDGAYHCPKCEAPFTRRSNLRRHYSIHTRKHEHRCRACGKGFTRSDELNYHMLNCSRETSWHTTGHTFRAVDFPDATLGMNSTAASHNDIISTPDSFSPIGSPRMHEFQDDQQFSDFLSSLALPDMSTHSDVSPFQSQSPKSSQGQVASGITRPSTASSTSSGSSISPQPAYNISEHYVHSPSRQAPPPKINGPRRRMKDKPIYTRRQVDDMLDAVSNCFVGTIEEVLRRTGSPGQMSHVERHLFPSSNPHVSDVRRSTLAEVLPRLLMGLQNGRGDGFDLSSMPN